MTATPLLASLNVKQIVTILGLGFLVSCGGGGGSGCDGMTKIKGGYPVDKRIDSAISLRMSKGLFDFLEQNGAVIVEQFLPKDGINVPSSCGGDTEICCGQTCKVIPAFSALTFAPAPPSTLTVTAKTKLRTSPDFNIKIKIPIIGSIKCTMSLDTTRAGKPDLGLQLPVVASVNPETKLTSINFDSDKIEILDLDNGDIDIDGNLACETADVLKGLFMGTLKDTIKKQLGAPLSGALCQKCTTKDDCSSLADQGCDAAKKVCMRKGVCMQQIGIEGRLDVGALLGGTAGGGATLDMYAVAGSYADVEAAPTAGLSLGMMGGSVTTVKNSCVPPRPAPTAATPLKKTAAYAGNTAPNGKPYHVGLGLSSLELDSLGHSFYQTGSLCMAIGTQQVELLSSGLFSVLVPSLAELTRGQNTSLSIVIRPQYPPTFVLGKGTFKTDGMGKKVIDDPLLRLQIKDLALDFYAFIDDRPVRFMRHTADVDVPLALDIDGTGQIVPMLGDLSNAFGNVRVSDSALLAETPDRLKSLLPSLLPTLLGSLSSSLDPIKLPDVAGFKLAPVQFAATPDPAGKLAYLGLFLALQLAPMPVGAVPQPATVQPVKTFADLVELVVPSQKALLNGERVRATLQVDVERPEGGSAEWQYRIDKGLWRPFTDNRQLVIDDPELRLAGSHAIEVRARIAGSPYSLDRRPARVTFNVAPTLDAEQTFQATEQAAIGDVPARGGCEMSSGRKNSLGGIALLVAGVLSLVGLRRRRPARSTLFGASALLLAGAAGACSGDGMMGPGPDGERTGPRPELNPIDEIGRYQSAAVRDGKIYISAYDSTVGDLAFTTVGFDEAATATLAWLPVDGLPPGEPTNMSKDAWRGGREDAGDDVGRYTALALSSRGQPIIAYQDVTNNTVKLAIKDEQGETWQTSTLSSDAEAKSVGNFITMVLDSSDVPTVAYMNHGVRKGDGKLTAQLMVARAGSATPSGESAWTRTPIAEAAVSCAGLCEAGEACVYSDPMVEDRLATQCKRSESGCTPGCKTGEACLASKCVKALGTPAADELEGTGLYARFVSSGAEVSLLFHDRASGAIKVASGSDWKVTTIDGGDGKVIAGKGIGAQIGTDGTLHVAYGDATHRVLYRAVKGGMPGPQELVDDGTRMVAGTPETHWVGGGLHLFLDADAPVVAYQDQTAGSLEAARKNGSSWAVGTVSPGGDKSRGYYPQAVSKDGRWLVLDVVYDRAATALSSTGFSPL